ncbi:hypothetical protein ACNF40_04430 [Cuniculiplasma sp. SKW4]|uniref:hypothetical protein n=1 Tax=Cuniculiplasma sp. SKW4 TaxID=3400171 RepID=UPI003FD04B19
MVETKTLKKTKTGEGRADHTENMGIEPHITVESNISASPSCFLSKSIEPPF